MRSHFRVYAARLLSLVALAACATPAAPSETPLPPLTPIPDFVVRVDSVFNPCCLEHVDGFALLATVLPAATSRGRFLLPAATPVFRESNTQVQPASRADVRLGDTLRVWVYKDLTPVGSSAYVLRQVLLRHPQ